MPIAPIGHTVCVWGGGEGGVYVCVCVDVGGCGCVGVCWCWGGGEGMSGYGCGLLGLCPGTHTCLRKGGHISVPDLKKDPFSRMFRLKNTPISMKMLTHEVRKLPPSFQNADIFHVR